MRLITSALLFAAFAAAQGSQQPRNGSLECSKSSVPRADRPDLFCHVSFHDGQGNRIKFGTVAFKAGESGSLSLLSTDLPSTGNPTGLYALATVPPAPVDQHGGPTCTLVTTMEVVETTTGATLGLTKGELVRPTGLLPAAPISLQR